MAKTKDEPSGPRIVEPEVFLSQHRRISDWLVRADEFKASGKAAVNTARAMGVNTKAYKTVRKWMKMERAEVEQDLRDVLLYARILDLGLFDQLDLFSKDHNSALAGLTSKVVSEHKEWEAEKEGYEAGKSGDPLDNNPHPAGFGRVTLRAATIGPDDDIAAVAHAENIAAASARRTASFAATSARI
jgi:hypothetical protein